MAINNAGTVEIKDLGEVSRIGFGAMRLIGPGAWGDPEDIEGAHAVVRRAVELGVDFIDTADSYGPEVSERMLCDVLHPYTSGVKVGTKAGQARPGPGIWVPLGRAEYLRQQVELSLRRLKVEALDLFQLHRIDPKVEKTEQFGDMAEMQAEGKIRALGLSEVSVEEIQQAQEHFTVATVQNRYNIADRKSERVLEYCEANGIAFLPWAPLDAGKLTEPGGAVDAVATRVGASHSQVALAWLLHRSPVMLPIPGTSSISHLEGNIAAADLELDQEARAALD